MTPPTEHGPVRRPAHDADPRAGIWTRLRDFVEIRFERWGHFVCRHAWATIALVLLFVGALASQVPKIAIDTSTEGFLEEGDPVRIAYDDFRRLFGRDEILLLAVEGEDVFDFTFLERLRALHEAVEDEVPKLEEVTSLLNARYTRGVGDELVVGDFLEDWPESKEDLETLRQRALGNPLYVDQLISADARVTTVLIQTDAYTSIGYEADEEDALVFDDVDTPASDSPSPSPSSSASAPVDERPFLSGEENSAIVAAVRELVARHQADGFRIHIAGNPVMIDQMMSAMMKDMGRFSGFALLAIGLLLTLLFRNLKAVALSLVVSVLAVASSLGVMSLLGMPLTSPTQIMPSFLLAVGVGNSVHVLVIYFQARSRGDDVEAALAYALGHSGLAIVMTALTTAGGLASFITADIAPVADLGWICPIGTMLSLFFALILLPALIAVVPMGASTRAGFHDRSVLRRIPIRLGDLGTRRPLSISLAWGAILAISFAGIAQIRFSHHPIEWFAPDHPIRVATELVNDALKGSIFLEVVVDTGRENGLHDPDILNRMEALQHAAEETTAGMIFVGKTVSLADVVKETHKALNENRADHYSIPQDPALVAQELLLFENAGSDDLEDFVDSQFRIGRVTLKLPMVDAIGFREFFRKLEPRIDAVLDGRATYHITGNWSILGRTINALIDSLSRTYVVAFATIVPLMILLLGSFRLGLLSMLPNVAAIVVTVGMMGWFGIPLDAFTLMIGSIALGLAVDDTIHFMHNFRRAFSRMGDAERAVHATLESTGQALFFTSLTLTAGFFIYMLASMKNLYYFGLLTGVAIAVAFLANVTLAPALVTLVARSGARGLLESRDVGEGTHEQVGPDPNRPAFSPDRQIDSVG